MRTNVFIGSAALALAASVLAGCGGGGSSNASGGYCDELKNDKAYFDAIGGSSSVDVSKLGDAFTRVHTLASKAPANVAADWKTLDGAITTIESALSDAGLTPADLAGLQTGNVPKGVDATKLQALIPKLQSLGSTDVSDAADAIAADAKKTCGVDLASTS